MAGTGIGLNLDLGGAFSFINAGKTAEANAAGAVGVAQVQSAAALEASKQQSKAITYIGLGIAAVAALFVLVFALK